MATVVLDTGGNGGNQLVLDYGSVVDGTSGEVTESSTHAKFSSLKAVVANGYSLNYNNAPLVASGTAVVDFSGNVAVKKSTGSSSVTIKTLTAQKVALKFGSTTSATVKLKLTLSGTAGTMEGTHTHSFPRRPYGAPTVTGVSIGNGTYSLSGRQATASSNYYWDKVDVRLSVNGGSYTDLAMDQSNSHTSGSFTAAANSRYRVAARAKNADRTGSYTYSSYYYTKPSKPTNLTANRSPGSTTVALGWTTNAAYGDFQTIERDTGSGWSVLAVVSASATSYSDTGVAQNLQPQYRVFVTTPTGANTSVSDKSNTAQAPLGYSTPDAPTTATLANTGTTTAQFTIGGNQNNSANQKYWQYVDWEVKREHEAFVTGATGLAGTTTKINLSGLLGNSRYQTQARSRNSAGYSSWKPSNFLYTTPTAPSGFTITRTPDADEIRITVASAGTWASAVRIEQSLNDGASWSTVATQPVGVEWVGVLAAASPAWFRFTALTPDGGPESTTTTPEYSEPLMPTDKSKLPGIAFIYHGEDRVRQIFRGSGRIWSDGGT